MTDRMDTAASSPTASWYVPPAFRVLSVVVVLAYLALPIHLFSVAGLSNRFPFIAALLVRFWWSWPSERIERFAAIFAVAAFGIFILVDMNQRFSSFNRDSIGASRLMNRLKAKETLLCPLSDGGPTKDFPGKPMVALEQYASVRSGGLPNSSFAGYGNLYIRYVGNRNPMPQLGREWLSSQMLTKFDYVMLRDPPESVFSSDRLRLSARDGRWVLFSVCGSNAHPVCS
jgi:hypothetical protein